MSLVAMNGDKMLKSIDGSVRIWSVGPVFEPDAEKEPSQTKLLATLSWHQSSVNCVRWTHSGQYVVL